MSKRDKIDKYCVSYDGLSDFTHYKWEQKWPFQNVPLIRNTIQCKQAHEERASFQTFWFLSKTFEERNIPYQPFSQDIFTICNSRRDRALG